MSTRIRLYRLGRHLGNDDIETSCGVMDIMKGSSVRWRIVTDCGLTPKHGKAGEDPTAPVDQTWTAPDLSLFDDGKAIDAVRITHVHGDHIGFLPALVPYLGRNARVVMTSSSAYMLPTVLERSLADGRRDGGKPPYDRPQMEAILSRISAVERPGEIDLLPGVTDYIHPEGHINGACSFTTKIGKRCVHYSGDRCSHDQPGIMGAQPLPKGWRPQVIAGSDCTYGADPSSDSRNWKQEMEKAAAACAEAMRKGHPALIFTFGLHRGGAIAHELQRLGIADIGRIFMDGSCRAFTQLAMDKESRWCERDRPLDVTRVRMIGAGRSTGKDGDREERMAIRAMRKGYAIIATPGMGGPGGVGTWWRQHVLPDPDAVILFSGYVAPGSDGATMLTAAKERDASGKDVRVMFEEQRRDESFVKTYPLRCKVVQARLGAHNPRGMILDWFREQRPMAAVLTHGSARSFDSLEAELRTEIPCLYRADKDHCVEVEL